MQTIFNRESRRRLPFAQLSSRNLDRRKKVGRLSPEQALHRPAQIEPVRPGDPVHGRENVGQQPVS